MSGDAVQLDLLSFRRERQRIDISAMTAYGTAQASGPMRTRANLNRSTAPDCVYVMSCPSMLGVVKVGVSKQPDTRAAQISNPGARWSVVWWRAFESAYRVEKRAHRRLRKFMLRSESEYFVCSKAVAVKAILKRKKGTT